VPPFGGGVTREGSVKLTGKWFVSLEGAFSSEQDDVTLEE
jgi:hypothetical protein